MEHNYSFNLKEPETQELVAEYKRQWKAEWEAEKQNKIDIKDLDFNLIREGIKFLIDYMKLDKIEAYPFCMHYNRSLKQFENLLSQLEKF